MRCNNCGYDNDSNVSTCIKCGHHLQSTREEVGIPNQGSFDRKFSDGESLTRPTVIGAAGNDAIGARNNIQDPTSRPTRVMNGSAPQGELRPTTIQANHTCPACGYLVMGNFSTCPQCGSKMSDLVSEQKCIVSTPKSEKTNAAEVLEDLNVMVTCRHCGKEISAGFAHCPYCGEKIIQETVYVRRYHVEPPKPKCSLTIVPEKDEQIEIRKKSYEGNSVILTRENTEPDNRSITTKNQAELVHKDNKWFIINHSKLNSTAVEANREIEIRDGDIIVLGDRRFKFGEIKN